MKLFPIITIFSLLFFGTAALSEPLPSHSSKNELNANISSIDAILTFNGDCNISLGNGETLKCDDKVAFIMGKNSSFLFIKVEEGFIILSGAEDRQPNINNYYLSISRFALKNKDLSEKFSDNNFEGECHFNLSDDGKEFYYVDCDVYNREHKARIKLNLKNITSTDIARD